MIAALAVKRRRFQANTADLDGGGDGGGDELLFSSSGDRFDALLAPSALALPLRSPAHRPPVCCFASVQKCLQATCSSEDISDNEASDTDLDIHLDVDMDTGERTCTTEAPPRFAATGTSGAVVSKSSIGKDVTSTGKNAKNMTMRADLGVGMNSWDINLSELVLREPVGVGASAQV